MTLVVESAPVVILLALRLVRPDPSPETLAALRAPCTLTANALESKSTTVSFAPFKVYPILKMSTLSSNTTATFELLLGRVMMIPRSFVPELFDPNSMIGSETVRLTVFATKTFPLFM